MPLAQHVMEGKKYPDTTPEKMLWINDTPAWVLIRILSLRGVRVMECNDEFLEELECSIDGNFAGKKWSPIHTINDEKGGKYKIDHTVIKPYDGTYGEAGKEVSVTGYFLTDGTSPENAMR